MKAYRFSPIETEMQLFQAVKHIHIMAHHMCDKAFGKYFPVSGNIGIFCHYDDEYKKLTEMRQAITEHSDNFNQKYYRLHDPIRVGGEGDIPPTIYTYLYIRKPDPYRYHVGDVDFYIPKLEYDALKQQLIDGKNIPGARLFPAENVDMIELFDPDIDVLAYVSTQAMNELIRTTKSGS